MAFGQDLPPPDLKAVSRAQDDDEEYIVMDRFDECKDLVLLL